MPVNWSDAPVLVVGFHHSGTRLLARQLASMGIFQVNDDGPFEWTYVQKLNSRICPAWCNPGPLGKWLDRPKGASVDKLEVARGLLDHGYAGGRWGIKDPRLCLTAAIWAEAYPACRIVIIHRDPVSVIATFPDQYAFFTPGKKKPLEEIAFWTELHGLYYVAMRRLSAGCRNVIELRYEDLVMEPEATLASVAEFLSIENRIDKVAVAMQQNPINASGRTGVQRALEEGRLSPDQHDLIRQATRPVARDLGYARLADTF